MITLDLSPHEQSKLETQSQQMGVSIEQYIKNVLFPQPQTIADFVKAMPNRSYLGDGLAIQKEIRNEWD